MDLSGCSEDVPAELLIREDCEGFDLMSAPSLNLEFPFTFLSLAAVKGVLLPSSSDDPGVFGVFPVDPNDAKAPDPRPKAEEAPLVGDATLVVVKGAIPLNGLVLLLKEPSPPNRFAGWYERALSPLLLSLLLLLVLSVESDNLLELGRKTVSTEIYGSQGELT